MKALEGAVNQEKALVGAFSVIVQPVVEPMDRFTALVPLHSWYLLPIPAPIHNNIANQFVAQYSAGPVTGAACAHMEIFLTNLI